MTTITAEALRTLLLENECIVEFTKVNGEVRSMPCTLKAEIVPDPIPALNFPHFTNTDNPIDFPKVKKENPNVMSVWCLDKKEWRSFRIANVISAKVKDETNTVQSK
jgi:hypothetical protein